MFCHLLQPALLLLSLLALPVDARAARDLKDLLPPASCGTGWALEGKPLFYDRDSLSDRIDGEAELYFPYGFDRLAAARYASEQAPGAGLDVEIYRMGSALDAFGIYANYRQKEGRPLNNVGAESNLNPSQLYFYQGRYFVHIQLTGAEEANQDALALCGRVAGARMQDKPERPPELTVLERPGIVQGSERYLPESLLGYDFLNQGILADAVLDGASLQVFYLLPSTGDPAQGAQTAFERYLAQLSPGKQASKTKDAAFLTGVDPLYGAVALLRKGPCLAGALKFSGEKGVRALLESICQ
jgi:hypothetical protein